MATNTSDRGGYSEVEQAFTKENSSGMTWLEHLIQNATIASHRYVEVRPWSQDARPCISGFCSPILLKGRLFVSFKRGL